MTTRGIVEMPKTITATIALVWIRSQRLTVWWQLGDTRASEFMDFDGAGRVVRSEAFYGK